MVLGNLLLQGSINKKLLLKKLMREVDRDSAALIHTEKILPFKLISQFP